MQEPYTIYEYLLNVIHYIFFHTMLTQSEEQYLIQKHNLLLASFSFSLLDLLLHSITFLFTFSMLFLKDKHHLFSVFYPSALKGCRGIVFTHGVRMGGWREKVCSGCI